MGGMVMIKVLIVDDEYIMRQGLKYMIDWEQEGFEIVGEATNGAEALQCIETLTPQIIICDIVMPAAGWSGFFRSGTSYVSENPDDYLKRI